MSQTSSFNQFPGEINLDNIEDVIAFHRETFGGYRMEDEGGEGDEGTPPVETPADEETPPEETEPDEAEGSEDEGDPEENEDDLPEWARKRLTKSNREAASYRTKLRDMEQRFEGAKTADEFEAALHQLREDNAEETRRLLVENVALRHKLPPELEARLVGATKEELEADAKSLAKFIPQDEDDDRELSGGLDPFDKDTDPSDPRELGRRARGVRTR